MPTFITSFVHHGHGWQKIVDSPQDRSAPIRAAIRELGGRLIGMYYIAGRYDGFIIYEAPDPDLVARAIVENGFARDVRSLKTSRLFNAAEVTRMPDGEHIPMYPMPNE
jgi:uncharacterized protein with GYD domain